MTGHVPLGIVTQTVAEKAPLLSEAALPLVEFELRSRVGLRAME